MKYSLKRLAKPIAFIVAVLFFITQLSGGAVFAADKKMGEWTAKSLEAYKAGKFDEAIQYAVKAIQNDPNEAEAYNARGLARYGQNQKDLSKLAVVDFDIAIKLKTDYVQAYANRGNAESDIGMYDAAIKDQDMALKLSPNYTSAYANRAWAYYKKEMYDQAIADSTRAIELNPNDADSYDRRGNSYFKKGAYDQAIQNYDTAIQLNPKSGHRFMYRASAYLKKKEYDKVLADCQAGAELTPGLAEIYDLKGQAYTAKKEYDLALKNFDLAIKLNPKNASYHSDRGTALKEMGRLGEAQTEIQEAVAMEPKADRFKKELAELNQTNLAGQSAPVESSATFSEQAAQPQNEQTAAPATSAAPASSSNDAAGGARVLAPFSGYNLTDTCGQSTLKISGVPWKVDNSSSQDAPAPTAQLGQYQSLLRHTMQGLQLFYGTMTAEETKSFDAFWAPFFDHPTAAALEYFQKINPLLDEMAVTVNTLDGMLSDLGQAIQETLITVEDPGSSGARVASGAYENVKAERAKLDDLVKQITALGNPPNPLAAKCAARKRHKKAVVNDGIWALLSKADYVGIKTGKEGSSRGADIYAEGANNIPKAELKWEGTKFTYHSETPNFKNPFAGVYVNDAEHKVYPEQHRFEGGGDLSKDGLKVIAFHGVSTIHECSWKRKDENDPGIEEVKETVKNFEYDNLNLALYKGKAVEGDKRIRLVYTNADSLDLSYKKFPEGAMVVEFSNFLKVKDAFDWVATATQIGNLVTSIFPGKDEQPKKTAPAPEKPEKVALGPSMGGGLSTGTGSQVPSAPKDPTTDPVVIAEAIAQHNALAAQISRDADRWAADAEKETNGDRKKELLTRAREMRANARAEQDIADSLKTGMIVHTRTEWDDQQHQALVGSIQKELAVFSVENKLMTNIPKVGDMIGGAEGVQLREQMQQRISEAIKSPDAVQKLAAIYSELQNKVMDQGEQKMASEQAKVEMWDCRVAVAEGVQWAASTGVMLGALWAPVEVGSLALGYAGATGFAEGGVKGGTIAVVRSVSSKADAIIAAYEGATKIDPSTGQPGGAWGAMEGALWAIGTNKAMEVIGGRIQKTKAEFALARQAAGGRGVKLVSRAGTTKNVMEYDYKAAEERSNMPSSAPTTTAPKNAVNKIPSAADQAKAKDALVKQAEGGKGVKAVAPAGEGRLKEYDFKTPEERYQSELEAAKTPAEKDAVNQKHAVQAEREKMSQEKDAALKKAEDSVHKGEDPAKAKEQYNKELEDIHKKYADQEKRNQEHKEVMEKLGFDAKEPTPEQKEKGIDNRDIKPTGSDPKNAEGDMDFTPQGATPHEAYQKGKKYVDEMKKREHNIVEYGDRWVDTTTDATIWKPGFGNDKPGSSSFEAEVIFGTMPHSDKFGTKGGIEWTSSATHTTADPLGAVLANTGKAVGAGLGNSHPLDLHTIGKSAAKAAEAAGVEVEPQLKAQIDALKAHKTPEQAGVVTLGADKATKDRETKAFLDKVQNLMGRAYKTAKTKSDQNMKALEKQANSAGKSDEAYQLRAQVKAYQAGNDAALTTISQVSPGLIPQMVPATKAVDLAPETFNGGQGSLNLGGLSRALDSDLKSAENASPLPADGNDKAFAGLGDRCKEGAKKVDAKLKAAKPGSEEAIYLADLKKALEQGGDNPAEAIRTVRGLSGRELAVVLAQLNVPAVLDKKKK